MSDKRDQNPGQDLAQPLPDAGRRRFLGGAAALGPGRRWPAWWARVRPRPPKPCAS